MSRPIAWIILFDSNVETVPPGLAKKDAMIKLANKLRKEPERMILDRSTHHFAMRGLRDGPRRGRPDIVHMSVLSVTDAPAYARGIVGLLIHTVRDELMVPTEGWRPPRNYRNFLGLMEELLAGRRTPPIGPAVLKLERGGIERALSRAGAERVILFSSHGEPCNLMGKLEGLRGSTVAFLVGAYAKGEPRREVTELADEILSIHPSVLSSSVVIARLLYDLERTTGLA